MSVTTACKDISALTENAQKACKLFISECNRCGLYPVITETYRSQERQNYLYEQGRTRGGKIVTWTKNSRHTSRRAWDVCKGNASGKVVGSGYDDNSFFKACGKVAAKLNITWGGTWKTADTPHFEITENWTYKGEDCMTATERQEYDAKITALENRIAELENPATYNYIDDTMPEWIRNVAIWARDNGIIVGTGGGWGITKQKAEMLVMVRKMCENMKG